MITIEQAVKIQKSIELSNALDGCDNIALVPKSLISIRPDDVDGEHYIPVEFSGDFRNPSAFEKRPVIKNGRIKLYPIYRSMFEDGECFEWCSFWVPITDLEELDVGLFRLKRETVSNP